MSTIYTFHKEVTSLATPAVTDKLLTADISTNSSDPTPKKLAISLLKSACRASTSTDVLGFYGATPVNQGTMTAVCLTAITSTATFSASNTGAGVFGFSSQTVANAYVTRVKQMQADLKTLIARVKSTGLVTTT